MRRGRNGNITPSESHDTTSRAPHRQRIEITKMVADAAYVPPSPQSTATRPHGSIQPRRPMRSCAGERGRAWIITTGHWTRLRYESSSGDKKKKKRKHSRSRAVTLNGYSSCRAPGADERTTFMPYETVMSITLYVCAYTFCVFGCFVLLQIQQ